MRALAILAAVLLLGACASTGAAGGGEGGTRASQPPETVDQVDLDRYTGTWYEIAAFPQPYQRGCTGTTATYTMREEGGIEVVNRCRRGGPDGPVSEVTGMARVVDESSNAKLEVELAGTTGDYWILELGDGYEYAVVGSPDRESLWILSRSPSMEEERYQGIVERLEQRGFDTERLERTEQPPEQP